MVLSWVLFLLYALAILGAALCGRGAQMSAAMLSGASDALTLSIALTGPICLWCALQRVMERTGISRTVSRLLRPLLRLVFPESVRDPEACAAISQNLGANLLGLGNAATPMGIRAVRRMRAMAGGDTATDEMCRLIVMNTASVQLIPATVAGIRASLGSQAPYAILPAVWLTSAASVTAGLLAARLLERHR